MDLSLPALMARALTTRRLVRAPIWLYQHGLGWLLGSRLMMLEHVGRKSGHPRYVVLEVVERPRSGVLLLVSGFGTTSQWYRNLQAEPRCFVSTGKLKRAPASARLLSDEESAAALARYARTYPRAYAQLTAAIEKATGAPAGIMPMVELELR